MVTLSRSRFLRHVALPAFLYSVIFFGASEIIENSLFNLVDEATLHVLHLVRGILSLFFVGGLVFYGLLRMEKSFNGQMETVCNLLDATREGLIALDSELRLVALNRRAAFFLEHLPAGKNSEWFRMVLRRLEEGSPVETEMGGVFLRITSLQSKNTGYLLLLQDVTDEKKVEEQLLIAEKMASLGRLAAGLAHEIGTPLNIISGRAELLEAAQTTLCTRCELRPECSVEKHVTVIFEQIERISRIMQQLLLQARPYNEEKNLFSLNDAIHSVAELFRPALEKRNIAMNLKIDRTLPLFYGSSGQIQQVLINLLANSMDAIDHDHGLIEVSSGFNGYLNISVKDNGSGISQADMTKIFDPFFTTKELGKGTGLGLTVSANIVRSYGGTIDVSTQQGQGTTLVIRLPRERSDE